MRKLGLQKIPKELEEYLYTKGKVYRYLQEILYLFLLLLFITTMYFYNDRIQALDPMYEAGVYGIALSLFLVLACYSTKIEDMLLYHVTKQVSKKFTPSTVQIFNHWIRYVTLYEWYNLKGYEIGVHKYYAQIHARNPNDYIYWENIAYSKKKRIHYRRKLIALKVVVDILGAGVLFYKLDITTNAHLIWVTIGYLAIAVTTQFLIRDNYRAVCYPKMITYEKERHNL